MISKKTLEFTETNNYFYGCTYEKTYLAVTNFLPAVRRFFLNLLTNSKVVGPTQKHFLLPRDINQGSISYSFQLHKIEMRNECKQHR